MNKREAGVWAGKLLDEVGVTRDRLDAFPHQLSGGMRQRVMIAMALALQPEILTTDEPTTALDVVTQRQILKRIVELQTELISPWCSSPTTCRFSWRSPMSSP